MNVLPHHSEKCLDCKEIGAVLKWAVSNLKRCMIWWGFVQVVKGRRLLKKSGINVGKTIDRMVANVLVCYGCSQSVLFVCNFCAIKAQGVSTGKCGNTVDKP